MSLILSGTDGLSDIDGSAATPAIRGTDANTGIFFPAADTIAFAEGGVEAMRIDSSGNVGIATSSPRVRLDVRSDAVIAAPTPLANAVTSGVLAIGNSVGSVVGLQLNGSSYDTYFQARNMGAGSTAYNLLLQPLGGNVGIGTSSPSRTLHVKSTDGVQTVLETTGASAGLQAFTNAGSFTVGAFDFTSSAMIFYTGAGTSSAAERMRIDSSGNLLFNSGYGSVATAYGCRAWVNFNGTGTVAIRASGNVSSITDNATGDYTVNFTTAMPDANYSLAFSSERVSLPLIINNFGPATGSARFQTMTYDTTMGDTPRCSISIFR